MFTRSHVLKISKILFWAGLAAVIILLAFIAVPSEKKGGIKFAPATEPHSVSIDVSVGEWEKQTYLNASEFETVTFDGRSAFYYENAATKDEQYSMDASVTSPRLQIFATDYEAEVRYFTRQKSTVPNRISAYVSADGEKYVLSDYVDVSDSGTEQAVWRKATLLLKGKVAYVRFVFTVYYSQGIKDGGIYFAHDVALKATSTSDYSGARFDLKFGENVSYDENTSTVNTDYCGYARYPELSVVSATTLGYYHRVRAAMSSDPDTMVEPVNSGEYVLYVDVYGDRNEKIASFKKIWKIWPKSVKATGGFALYNNDCVAFYGVKFLSDDGESFTAKEIETKTIYKKGDDEPYAVDFSSKNFSVKGFDKEKNPITAVNAKDGVLYAINDGEYEYDGEEKTAESLIVAFKTLDARGNPVPVTDGASVDYYKSGAKLDDGKKPVDAGEYEFSAGDGEYVPTGKITIKPKKITEVVYRGESSFDKVYDGTKIFAENGKFVDTLEGLKFIGVGAQEISVECGGAEYGRTKGNTYVLAKNCREESGNYTFDEKTPISGAKAAITPSTLILRSFINAKSAEIKFESRQYDGTDDVTVIGDEDAELDVTGAAGDVIALRSVTAKADDKNSGVRKVTLSLNDQTLFDRFAPVIKTENPPQITIYPKTVTASVQKVAGATKIYDETAVATLTITEIQITEETETELIAATEKGYEVAYESAIYDTPAAGADKEITVFNAKLLGRDAETETVFSNYVIERMTANGAIEPKPIEVTTKQIRVYRGESLPDPEITGAKTGILSMKAYRTASDAKEGDETKALPSRITETGEYFVRAECVDGNYKLDPVVIPLFVVDTESQTEQFVVFDDFNANLTTSIVVPVNGEFSLGATSVTSDGTGTGVKLVYEVIEGTAAAEQKSDGVFVAKTAGEFSVIVKAKGNSYYKDAESVEIKVEAKKISLTATASGGVTLIAGDPLPTTAVADDVKFVYNGNPIVGSFRPQDENETLTSGTNSYDYLFSATKGYLEKRINYIIDGDVYEKTVNGYVKTTDVKYAKNKEYYRVIDTSVAVSVGDELPENCYEKIENEFVATSDTTAATDKKYYTLEVSECNEIKVSSDGYFIKDESGYKPVEIGAFFDESETYYVRGKEFYGEKQVSVEFTAIKAGVTLTLGNTVVSPYSETVDFTKLIKRIKISGTDYTLPIAELKKFDGRVELFKVTVGEETTRERIDVRKLFPGIYTVYADGTAAAGNKEYYEIVADDEEFEYEITFENSAQLEIVKSKIRVVAPIKQKYYYADEEKDETLVSAIKIDGKILDGDDLLLRNCLKVRSVAAKRTTVGEYAIEPYVKDGGKNELEELNRCYEFEFVQGYVEVLPAEITVYAVSFGQIYGAENQGEITVAVSLGANASEFSREDLEEITEIIKAATKASVNVDRTSDAGDYPISIIYNGDTKNFAISYGDSVYTVHPDTLEGFSFSDKKVLYDGERHTIEVAYDKTKWPNVTVVYDKDYFVDKGTYVFKATVSAKNYNTLELLATLTIGTLTIESSSLTGNVVGVTFDENDCPYGVLPELYLVYKAATEEKKTTLKQNLENKNEGKRYEIISSFDVQIYLDGAEYRAEYPTYEIRLKTKEFKFSDDLKLFGYGENGYGELKFTYENGVYKTKATKLEDFVFAKEKVIKTSPVVIWICVGIFVIIILIALGIVFGGGNKAKKERMRSRRRHHRWA